MNAIHVGVVCDLREEGWHSMDLVADMLLDALPAVGDGLVQATRLRAAMVRRWTRVPLVGGQPPAHLADRLLSRLWDYPRWLARRADEYEVFHIVDHSYAHLVGALPAARAIVTCNDTDAFEAAHREDIAPWSPARVLASYLLRGIAGARHVACITEATRNELLALGCVPPERVSVVHLAAHPACSPATSPADVRLYRQLGITPGPLDILHVGSTIPRKRIDLLLRLFASVRERLPAARLIRVGGDMMHEHRALARDLDVSKSMLEVPFVDRAELAVLYRGAAVVLLPSDREGFGLPLVEAMACGTPVIASAIPALMEVGGEAAVFCPPGDVNTWGDTVTELLQQHERHARIREARREACLRNAARFSWTTYAKEMAKLYQMCGAEAG